MNPSTLLFDATFEAMMMELAKPSPDRGFLRDRFFELFSWCGERHEDCLLPRVMECSGDASKSYMWTKS